MDNGYSGRMAAELPYFALLCAHKPVSGRARHDSRNPSYGYAPNHNISPNVHDRHPTVPRKKLSFKLVCQFRMLA